MPSLSWQNSPSRLYELVKSFCQVVLVTIDQLLNIPMSVVLPIDPEGWDDGL